jgi:hypothetical protein
MQPTLTILGVYRLDVTRKVFSVQLAMYGDEQQCRDHFSSVVLIEASVDNADDRFNLSDFTQANPAYPYGARQVPWDEGLLSADGTVLLARKINCVRGHGSLRFGFYMHYWDSQLPLRWTFGEAVCPEPRRMPTRLTRLMPYRPCD